MNNNYSKKYKFLFLLIIVLICSCNIKENGKTVYKYYEDGTLESKIECNKNFEYHGIAEYYFPNGRLEANFKYKNGNLDGIYKRYYENGNLLTLQNFICGRAQGMAYFYYKSGKLKEIAEFRDDKKVFWISWDSLGSPFWEGRSIIVSPKSDTIQLGETYDAKLKFSGPTRDSIEYRLYISQPRKQLKKQSESKFEYFSIPNKYYKFSFKIDSVGKYYYTINYSYTIRSKPMGEYECPIDTFCFVVLNP